MLSIGRVLFGVLAAIAITGKSAIAAEDPRDAAAAREVLQVVLETEKSGVEVPWSSSVTGNKGIIRVERTFFRTPELPCRDYVRTIEQESGAKLTIRGTGCRVADKSWSLEEQPAESAPAKDLATKATKSPKSVTPAEERPTPPDKSGDSLAAAAPSEAETKKPARPAPVQKKAPPLLEFSLPTKTDL